MKIKVQNHRIGNLEKGSACVEHMMMRNISTGLEVNCGNLKIGLGKNSLVYSFYTKCMSMKEDGQYILGTYYKWEKEENE